MVGQRDGRRGHQSGPPGGRLPQPCSSRPPRPPAARLAPMAGAHAWLAAVETGLELGPSGVPGRPIPRSLAQSHVQRPLL